MPVTAVAGTFQPEISLCHRNCALFSTKLLPLSLGRVGGVPRGPAHGPPISMPVPRCLAPYGFPRVENGLCHRIPKIDSGRLSCGPPGCGGPAENSSPVRGSSDMLGRRLEAVRLRRAEPASRSPAGRGPSYNSVAVPGFRPGFGFQYKLELTGNLLESFPVYCSTLNVVVHWISPRSWKYNEKAFINSH